MKTLISIVGPTAIGKTALSIDLAKHFQTVILSADSRQFYREMNIGTAKVSAEEQAQVPHYFLDFLNPDESYNAGQFEREAEALLEQLFQQHEVVILAGGSTLYLNTLWHGIDEMPDVPEEIRAQLNAEYQEKGINRLAVELAQVDPDSVFKDRIDTCNPARVIRALEIYRATGIPISQFKKKTPKQTSYQHLKIALTTERTVLYERIDKRVLQMLEMGLVEEVKDLLAKGYTRDLPPMNAIGYKEVIAYLNGERETTTYKIMDYALMQSKIQQHSRNYAKRQLTWFRREKDLIWLDSLAEKENLCEKVVSLYEDFIEKSNKICT
ncbi:MAG: tRNA (adenosine(37)-N6)-dimethylallyltransferase MiaA [Bacteroidia bacterium]